MIAFISGMVSTTVCIGALWYLDEMRYRRNKALASQQELQQTFESITRLLEVAKSLSPQSYHYEERPMFAIAVGPLLQLQQIEERLIDFLGYSNRSLAPKYLSDLMPSSITSQVLINLSICD